MGAWIETSIKHREVVDSYVAPLVGAWIETSVDAVIKYLQSSHPSWVRGLKLVLLYVRSLFMGRTPRGCVD